MNGQFELGDITPTKYFVSISVVLGLLFAMISNDNEQPAIVSFLQWQLQAIIPIALLIGGHMVLLKSSLLAKASPWLALVISGLIAGTLFTPVALAIDYWLQPLDKGTNVKADLWDEWTSVCPPIVICWLALNSPWLLGYQIKKRENSESEEALVKETLNKEYLAKKDDNKETLEEKEVMQEPTFMTLLQPEKRGNVLFLKSELHYLQVATDHGGALILYNLGDAISELPNRLGLQVHRSYWVAFEAIENFSKKGRQGEITLKDGQKIPVSRNKLDLVSAQVA